jgi:hypothetical protein
MHWSAGHQIEYCVGGGVGLGGYRLNIHLLYAWVSRTLYRILCEWCCRIRRTLIEYSSTVYIGQPDIGLNIVWVVVLD